MKKLSLSFIWFLLWIGMLSICSAVTLSTGDGFQLLFSDVSGSLEGIRVDGTSLPLNPSVTGGLSFMEGIPISSSTVIFYQSFESDTPAWNNAQNSDWTTSQLYYTWNNSGGVGNSRYLTLGNGITTGAGIAFNKLIPVTTGSYRCSWFGKSTDTTSKYIFCLRLFDATSTDITSQIPSPAGWSYSATSKAQVIYGMSNLQTNLWEEFSSVYTINESKVKYLTLSIRYWTGGDFYVNVDELKIEKTGGIEWSDEIPVSASLGATGDPNQYRVTLLPVGRDLSIQLLYKQTSSFFQIDGEFTDLRSTSTSRFFRIFYTLPVNGWGWYWEDDIYRHRLIQSTASTYENNQTFLDWKTSLYPFNSISNGSTGLALAVPMEQPIIQTFAYQQDKGFRTEIISTILPLSMDSASRKIKWSLYLYKTDNPDWGFRSTAKKYYQLFLQTFTKNNPEEGCWAYGVTINQIPQPLDFGLKFYETSPPSSTVVDFCRQNNIEIYHYMEPWGVWQNVGFVTTKPPYEDRVQTMINWAQDTLSSLTWMRAPRWYTAQAILNSAYQDASSRYYIDSNSYYWHQWSGSSAWNQLWPCANDSTFTYPNTWSLYKNYYVDYRIDNGSGMYVDSIISNSMFGNMEDFRYDHITTQIHPLSLSIQEGRPVLSSQFVQQDYLHWLMDYLHSKNKKVMGNIFPGAYRYYVPYLDILGSEVFQVSEGETDAALRRTLSYQKTNTNLLQWWETNYLTGEEMETYIKNQLFYGFFPGVSAAGGGLNYGLPDRYFLHPELYERDRPTFKNYIPLIKTISQAGWEPITLAISSSSDIRIERFGNWSTGIFYFNLKNTSLSEQTVLLQIDSLKLGISSTQCASLNIRSLPDQTVIPYNSNLQGNRIQLQMILSGNGINTLQIKPLGPVGIESKHWRFLE